MKLCWDIDSARYVGQDDEGIQVLITEQAYRKRKRREEQEYLWENHLPSDPDLLAGYEIQELEVFHDAQVRTPEYWIDAHRDRPIPGVEVRYPGITQEMLGQVVSREEYDWADDIRSLLLNKLDPSFSRVRLRKWYQTDTIVLAGLPPVDAVGTHLITIVKPFQGTATITVARVGGTLDVKVTGWPMLEGQIAS